MKTMHLFAMAAIAALTAGAAQAQEAQAVQNAAAPAAAAAADSAAGYSDAEVHEYTAAAMQVQKVLQDSSLTDADKQPKMAAIVAQSGLSPERFNAIAKASASDPALMQRISQAAADVQKEQQAAPEAAPAAQ